MSRLCAACSSHVRRPPDGASRREGRGEHLAGDTAAVHDDPGVELHVGEQPAAGLHLCQDVDRGALDLCGEVDQWTPERARHVPEEH